MMKKVCLQCKKALTGRQSKYCSRQCKNIFLNQSLQSYEAQQERGRKRKLELIKLKVISVRFVVITKTILRLNFIIEDH